MKYRSLSQLVMGGMAVVLLTTPGCSSMKWLQGGSEDQSASEGGRPNGQGDSGQGYSSQGDRDGQGRSGGGVAAGEGTRDGQFPSTGRQGVGIAGAEEGGALRGFSPLVNGQIAGEERLSRSNIGNMLMPVDRDEKWYAEIRREETAAMEAGLKDVFYGYDRYNISDDGMTSLTSNADWLKEHPQALLKVSGHCDERGTHDYNLVLGEKRAKAAKRILVDLGVSPKQVAIVSYGKDRPFCADHDEACHQQNRRGHMLLRK
jgi:peptidoglycan-associated lipoprotein